MTIRATQGEATLTLSDKFMVINICRGGLANRLKPLSSCFALAKKTNRKIGINWSVDSHCGARFDQLYSSPMDNLSLDWLQGQPSISLYADEETIINWRFKELIAIREKFGIKPLSKAAEMISDGSDFLVVYGNDYLAGSSADECKEFFDWLTPTRAITEKIANVKKHMKLDKSVIGVHARGTDFGGSVNTYLELMRKEYSKNRQAKFFLCSDSREYEEELTKEFPNAFSYKKRSYVSKLDEKNDWNSGNMNRSSESVMEAVVDMHLLSSTNFKIFNVYSSFAHVVTMMSSGRLDGFPKHGGGSQSNMFGYLKLFARKARNLFRS